MATPNPLFEVRAIAPYQARNTSEVSLEVGKTYVVLQTDGRDLWWQTKSEDGCVGWFPASYTEVIQELQQAPLPPAPDSTLVQQQQQQQYQQQQQQQQRQQCQQQPPLSPRPTPVKKNIEKGDAECFVILHLIKAKDLVNPKSPSTVAMIYKRDVTDKSEHIVLQTAKSKKSHNPDWNELFKLQIQDCERKVVCVRVFMMKKFNQKVIIGELEFPLRQVMRGKMKIDTPGTTAWWPLKGGISGKETVGEVYAFIEFVDTRKTEGPKEVFHIGHVGLDATGAFEIDNIPSEWKQLFRQLHIKKKDLKSNPELKEEVMNIMKKDGAGALDAVKAVNSAHSLAPVPSTDAWAPQPSPQTPTTTTASPPPPPPPTSSTTRTAPPPSATAVAPPPPPTSTGPRPPPPPPPPAEGASAGAAEDDTMGGGGGGGGMGSLTEEIKKVKLHKVEHTAPPPPSSTGNTLADMLLMAMKKHRVDIEGNDKTEEKDDDWPE